MRLEAVLLDHMPVASGGCLAGLLANHNEQERQSPEEHADERDGDIRILHAGGDDPGCDGVPEAKTHRVADADHGNETITRDFSI